MDTMRGGFGSPAESDRYDQADEDYGQPSPPPAIGQDERRMQVRAYNHWASLLEDRSFPAIEDLEPENLPDFGPYSVLLDFSTGIEDPGIAFLGEKLAEECGVVESEFSRLSEVPGRSLLSRITDHYLQIIANQAPIGFEAEFVNQRGSTIAYRGILLPYSSDDDTIDFVYGVINWKELADAQASDELLLEIDQALEPRPSRTPLQEAQAPLTDWADGPGSIPANDTAGLQLAGPFPLPPEPEADDELPTPSFGLDDYGAPGEGGEDYEDEDGEFGLLDESGEAGSASLYGSLLRTPITVSHSVSKMPVALPEFVAETAGASEVTAVPLNPAEMSLGDWLAEARAVAVTASACEDRTRAALYEAIARAYDFSLAAAEQPEEFEALLREAGLKMQGRAPMTPVVKLVFGADYDKTRITEYAAALSHAHRLGIECGELGDYLAGVEGGLKGVVKAERRLRREAAGKAAEPAEGPRPALATKLRALAPKPFEALPPGGSEFALLMIRRTDCGDVALLGEVPEDVALVERAARRMIG